MSNEEFAGERASITLKGGRDFDSPWIVVKGGSVEDAANELRKLETDEATLRAVATVAATFHRVYVEAKSGAQEASSPAPTEQTPQASQPAPQQAPQAGGEIVFCTKCGTQLEWRSWERKADNKAFKGYFCPNSTAKGDGHQSVFR